MIRYLFGIQKTILLKELFRIWTFSGPHILLNTIVLWLKRKVFKIFPGNSADRYFMIQKLSKMFELFLSLLFVLVISWRRLKNWESRFGSTIACPFALEIQIRKRTIENLLSNVKFSSGIDILIGKIAVNASGTGFLIYKKNIRYLYQTTLKDRCNIIIQKLFWFSRYYLNVFLDVFRFFYRLKILSPRHNARE